MAPAADVDGCSSGSATVEVDGCRAGSATSLFPIEINGCNYSWNIWRWNRFNITVISYAVVYVTAHANHCAYHFSQFNCSRHKLNRANSTIKSNISTLCLQKSIPLDGTCGPIFEILWQLIREKILYVYIRKISTVPEICWHITLWQTIQ